MGLEKIALIGAMNEEIEQILSRLNGVAMTKAAGIEFHEGSFAGRPVVLCKSGVGKVNAAVCTQLLIDRFGVSAVIFTGVAGAVDPALDIGDLVISTDCMQHDVDASALGFPKGTIPFAERSVFEADARLIRLAEEAALLIGEGKALKGRVLSGDQFIADRTVVGRLYEEMNGACTEMEGAAVAQVCTMNGIPFVVIRSMSDKADGSAHVNFAEFTALASRNSCRIVEGMLASIGQS